MKQPTSTPFQMADRTPLVLTTERLASLPPPGTRRALVGEILDTGVLVGVWFLLAGCALVLIAGAVALCIDAIAGGAS